MFRFVFCMSAACLACACGSQFSQQTLPPVVYACEDGSRLTMSFAQDAARVIQANGEAVTLRQKRAASGIWYATDNYELRGKGDDATWTVDGVAKACHVTQK